MAAQSVKQQWIDELEAEFGLTDIEEEQAPILSFREFVDRVKPKYRWYRHCEILANVLQAVAEGKRKRVMIFMPPRHGKSELATRLFPAYYLYRHGSHFVGINSYAADLAYTFSRAVRENFRSIDGEIKEDSSAVKHWETISGGGCWAAGVGGPITGKGFHLGIIDDPLKNSEAAFSDTIRRNQKEWYESTFSTREEPRGAIVVILTRWHEDDLAGWLLQQEKSAEEEDELEHWHIVNFPAVYEPPPQFPESCTTEPDWRNEGEPLCPERSPLKKLKKFQKSAYFWSALFQQRPAPLEGNYFKRSWWQFYQVLPAQFEQVVLSLDCTFKDASDSDFVVMQVWGKKEGCFYLLDQVRDRMDINATLTALQALVSKHPKAKAKLVEDKANGTAVIDLLKRKIPGLIPINPEGGKVARAVAISPYVESGNVFLPEPDRFNWVSDYLTEFANFPNGSNDDQVDATSQAIGWLEAHQPMEMRRSGLKLY